MSDIKEQDRAAFFFRNRYRIFFGLIALLTIINLTVDIMEVDAAQYASISHEMSQTGNYLEVYHKGQDYLDKPPLLFWLSSLSISVFGNSNLGYKLPAVLLLWLGLWATYKFGSLWYDRRTGIIAALVLGSTQAYHLMTNDVRTDGLLTSFIILAVYFLSVYLKKGKILSLLMGGFCIGCAMLAKGPIGLIIPLAAIGGHLLIHAQWKKIFNWRWLMVIPVIVLVLAPMLYGLYTQFDLHPEKEVYGLKGPSGIGFYFWTQSFGRITGENTWQNNTPVFYFLQTILWDFSPWILLFIPSFFLKIKILFNKRGADRSSMEWISLCGFIVPFIALSFSNYKLPHYIFPLFPFAAVMTAAFLVKHASQLPRWFEYFYLVILHVFVVIAILLTVWAFPTGNIFIIALMILFYALFWWTRKTQSGKVDQWLFSSLIIVFLFQFVMSLHFYPSLLKYQSSSQAGKWIAKEKTDEIYWHHKYGFALEYYAGRTILAFNEMDKNSILPGTWIYTDDTGLKEFPGYKIIKQFDDYPVTLLSKTFLNPETREKKIKKVYLVEIMSN